MANKPKYKWSQSKRRYLTAAGNVVADSTVRAWVQQTIDASRTKVAGATLKLVAGKMSVADWTSKMEGEVKAAHRAMALIANGGTLDADAEKRLSKVVKAQLKFLTRFSNGLDKGSIALDGRVSPRAQSYIQATRCTYENEVRQREKAAGMKKERRILTAEESCESDGETPGCVEIAKKGWVAIGTLPEIGSATCRVGCKCYFEFK
jgi:hypothetical protein